MGNVANLLNLIFVVSIITAFVIAMLEKTRSKNKNYASDSAESLRKKSEFDIGSVQEFLDFDRVYNSMIIRNGGRKFTMVINCSGINYDLMSEGERSMVEEAFIELLNFIRFPIQIYVQTRKVDLKDSLKTYDSKISMIEGFVVIKVSQIFLLTLIYQN